MQLRLTTALIPLLLILLAQPTRASCPAGYNETGHALFETEEYMSRCDFMNGLGTGNFTLELWVKIPSTYNGADFPPTSATGIPLFSYATDGVQNAMLVWNVIKSDPYLQLVVHSSDTKSSDIRWALNDDEWHHIAVTRTRTCAGDAENANCCFAQFYKDGELIFTETTSTQCKLISDGGCVVLGQEQDALCRGFHVGSEFVGSMTELRMWNASRSISDILEYMHQRIGPSAAPNTESLVALWPLNCIHTYAEHVAAQNLTTCEPDQTNGHGRTLATFEASDGTTCSGFDECCEGTHNCDVHATCNDTLASFTCECDPPYEGNGAAPPPRFSNHFLSCPI
ncbi:concanavalin A-like lectin/glucanase domain-containing protein [Baffinella frigidus]|nr:concanavalin A-like lectin/glucanase domain-containing protein [Cryptophyta sp. CCMP2293]